jgi:mono/diheme cytochrome c family protein
MKRYLLYGFGSLAGVVLLVVVGAAFYLQFYLPRVGPPPDISVELTPENIERGKYLANHVSACMSCHVERDWSRFAAPPVESTIGQGGERFGREEGLPGVLYAPNITPEGLGNWTDGEIFRAITSGVDREGNPLFPLMPYEKFGSMDPEDIKAIIAYLRSLPPKPGDYPTRELDFPVNWIVRTMPQRPNHLDRPDPEEDVLAYGRYLTRAAACSNMSS